MKLARRVESTNLPVICDIENEKDKSNVLYYVSPSQIPYECTNFIEKSNEAYKYVKKKDCPHHLLNISREMGLRPMLAPWSHGIDRPSYIAFKLR